MTKREHVEHLLSLGLINLSALSRLMYPSTEVDKRKYIHRKMKRSRLSGSEIEIISNLLTNGKRQT